MRLTHLKVTGGSLRVKMVLKEEEKVDQIRIYSGSSIGQQRRWKPEESV